MNNTVRIHWDEQLKQGTKMKDTDSNKVYEVVSCIDLDWLSEGEKKGYMVALKEVKAW